MSVGAIQTEGDLKRFLDRELSSLTVRLRQLQGAAEPTGVLKAYAGGTAPIGYLLCDGSAVSREDYAALFEVLGTTYGAGDGSTTFNLPDLRDRVPVGASGTIALGATGGAKTHTLTIGEMPSHSHNIQVDHTNTDPTANNNRPMLRGITTTTGFSTDNQGGGGAHNNMQPYIGINWVVKT